MRRAALALAIGVSGFVLFAVPAAVAPPAAACAPIDECLPPCPDTGTAGLCVPTCPLGGDLCIPCYPPDGCVPPCVFEADLCPPCDPCPYP